VDAAARRAGGRHASHGFAIEIDSVEVLPFLAIAPEDIVRSSEPDREALRQRGPRSADSR
jgi:hypothetical protein